MWLIIAAVSNVALGTVRQIAWLGILVMVPCTAWLLRERKRLLKLGVVLWLFGAVTVLLCLHWFARQPYSLPEKLIDGHVHLGILAKALSMLIFLVLTVGLFALPVLIGLPIADLARRDALKSRSRFRFSLAGTSVVTALTLGAGLIARRHLGHFPEHIAAPWLGNTATIRGLWPTDLIGLHPVELGLPVRVLISLLEVFTLFYWLHFALRRSATAATHRERELNFLLLPFAIAYTLLLMPRGVFHVLYDRYAISLLLVASIYVLSAYQAHFGPRLGAISVAMLAVFGLFAVAETHDFFSFERARVAAADQLLRAGVTRPEIDGGFEYNGWTQIVSWGYMNHPDLVNPPGAYHPEFRSSQDPCIALFAKSDSEAPVVQPKYLLTYDESCYQSASVRPVHYKTLLPPYNQVVYVRKVTRGRFPEMP